MANFIVEQLKIINKSISSLENRLTHIAFENDMTKLENIQTDIKDILETLKDLLKYQVEDPELNQRIESTFQKARDLKNEYEIHFIVAINQKKSLAENRMAKNRHDGKI